jgi:hypothetical protein
MWLGMAQESLATGLELHTARRVRSAASRLYYSAYQSVHAILPCTPLRASIPPRGNWDHRAIMNGVLIALTRYAGFTPQAAHQLRLRLIGAFATRVEADYLPRAQIDARSIASARAAAIGLNRIARRMVEA